MDRTIAVFEEPVPNARHRTGKGREYTPTATLEARHRIREVWIKAHGSKPEKGPVELDVQVYLPRPAGHFGTGRARATTGTTSASWPLTRCCVSRSSTTARSSTGAFANGMTRMGGPRAG